MRIPISQTTATQTLPFILAALALLALAACEPVTVAAGGTAAAIYLTKPSDPPPADVADQIQPHETWCYETLGPPACYAHPQPDAGNRLINVDPPNLYPLTPRAYYETTVEDQ
jgi:hypothetical protein